MKAQSCLICGMHVDRVVHRCPKCDNQLDEQTDGSTVTVDIAHNGERVHEALRKMNTQVEIASQGVTQYIRFIVGSGIIRDEVMVSLDALKRQGVIIHGEIESGNNGSVMVKLKP